jgi:hypothetical protein
MVHDMASSSGSDAAANVVRDDSAATSRLELMGSRHFPAWLAERRVSHAFTTCQSGKLFLIGLQPDSRLSVFERTFNRCLGLWSDGQTLWMSSLYQLWRFEIVVEPGQIANGYDRLYAPKVGYVTGDLDIHDGGNRLLKNVCREGEAPAEPRETRDFPRASGSAGASPSLFQQAAKRRAAWSRSLRRGRAFLAAKTWPRTAVTVAPRSKCRRGGPAQRRPTD